jgi:hypothetical protein
MEYEFMSWAATAPDPIVKPTVGIINTGDPDATADAAIPTLSARAAADRYIMVYRVEGLLTAATLKRFVTHGPNIIDAARWFKKFYQRLNSAGITPAFVSGDDEQGLGVWNIFPGDATADEIQAIMSPIYDDPKVKAMLPDYLQVYTAASFRTFSQSWYDWDRYASSRLNAFIRRVIHGTGRDVFGPTFRASNWRSMRVSFPISNLSGEPFDSPGVLAGSHSGPVAYNDVDGSKYTGDDCWQALLDGLNGVISCLLSGMPVSVWIDFPSHPGTGRDGEIIHIDKYRWVWRQKILHLAHMGVRTFIYFNPVGTPQWSEDQTFAAGVFAEAEAVTESACPTALYDLSATTITSGSFTTTFADYLANS